MHRLLWPSALSLIVAIVYLGCGSFILKAIQWILYIMFLPLSFSLEFRFGVLHLFLVGIPLSLVLYLVIHYCLRRRYSKLSKIPSKISTLGVGNIVCDEEYEKPDPLATFMSSIRIFGYLEPEVYAELQTSKTEEKLEKGETRILDGFNFYVVIEGKLEIRLPRVLPRAVLTEALMSLEGLATNVHPHTACFEAESVLAEVGPGGIASSLLDILSILTHSEPISSLVVNICAVEPTRLLRIPSETFKRIKSNYPKASAHIVQVIMSRFQRVTFLTLNQYLGLTKESLGIELSLSSRVVDVSPSIPADSIVPALNPSGKLSPTELQDCKTRTVKYLLELFSLEVDANNHFLRDIIELCRIPIGTILFRQGDRSPGLFILLQGKITVYSSANSLSKHGSTPQHLLTIALPGSLIGSLSAFLGSISMMTVAAEEESIMAFVPRKQVDWLIDRYPQILFTTANLLLTKLSPTICSIDLALDWKHLDGGEVLCHEGETATHIYIVIHGRIQSIQASGSDSRIIGEFGPGDSIGESEMILREKLSGTLVAMRDSEVACLPRILFDALAAIHPEVSLNVSKIIALKHRERVAPINGSDVKPSHLVRNVAILPLDSASHDLAMIFAHRLREEISLMESVVLLDGTQVTEQLGKHAFSAFGKLKLTEWLNEIEGENRIVMYLADVLAQSKWTQRCIRQADCIFVVARAEADPAIGSFERILFLRGVAGKPSMTRTELVLVHSRPECPSTLTRRWLQGRIWISAHHHVRLSSSNLILTCIGVHGT